MEYKKNNYVEVLNEFSILMCSYIMNIFLANEGPADFMS